MIQQFRQKAVRVDAVQVDGANGEAICSWVNNYFDEPYAKFVQKESGSYVKISGNALVSASMKIERLSYGVAFAGDWVTKTEADEFSIVNAADFAIQYDQPPPVVYPQIVPKRNRFARALSELLS